MDLLLGNSQQLHQGYPIWLFYGIAAVGIALSVLRPYWAFLVAVFCLSARDFHAAVFTRVPVLGPYLNLNDLLLWIATLALCLDLLRRRRQPWIPPVLLLILSVLVIASLQSLYQYGFEYEVLKRIWMASIFPVMFIVATNMILDERRARAFFWALFCGATLAALTHTIYVSRYFTAVLYGGPAYRTISYLFGGGDVLLVVSILLPLRPSAHRAGTAFYYGGLALMALSLMLSLTRGAWLSAILALVILAFMLRRTFTRTHLLVSLGIVAGVLIVIVSIFLRGDLLLETTTRRAGTLANSDDFEAAYDDRSQGATTELDLWLNHSPLIIGLGIVLPMEVVTEYKEDMGALTHVGFSTYLVRFGLLGLVFYLVLLNVLTIRVGTAYFRHHLADDGGRVAILGVACAITHAVGCFGAWHLFAATTQVQGLLYGSAWGLYRSWYLQTRQLERRRPSMFPGGTAPMGSGDGIGARVG